MTVDSPEKIHCPPLEEDVIYARFRTVLDLKKGDEMNREEILDLSILSELLILQEDDESDIIDEMMSFYFIEAAERLKDIRKAIDIHDDQWLMKTAHKFKGSSSQMGAARVASLCSRLGTSVKEEDRENILSLLREEFDVFRVIVSEKPWRKMSSAT